MTSPHKEHDLYQQFTNMKVLKYIGLAVAVIVAVDVVGFLLWAGSGQKPADSFFIGAITYHLLQ